jgi:hypothetical protein
MPDKTKLYRGDGMSTELAAELIELFQKTIDEHKLAFQSTQGADPDWPIWYAEHLYTELSRILQANFTRSELIYLLVLVDKEQRLRAPGSDWRRYYAQFFLDRYR